MSEGARSTLAGVAGGSNINVDLRPLDHAAPKKVTLSANYTVNYPPGYPTPPDMTGAEHKAGKLYSPGRVIASGTTIALLGAEADALVAAGKASYA
jgi:hypothetical protein